MEPKPYITFFGPNPLLDFRAEEIVGMFQISCRQAVPMRPTDEQVSIAKATIENKMIEALKKLIEEGFERRDYKDLESKE